jgi:hypothetical protein
MDSKWMVRSERMGHAPGVEAPLRDRLQRYFDCHPEVSPQDFLLQAVRREIGEREQKDRVVDSMLAGAGPLPSGPSLRTPVITEEDVRIHAWLNQRLLLMTRQRQSVWGKARRFIRGLLPLG